MFDTENSIREYSIWMNFFFIYVHFCVVSELASLLCRVVFAKKNACLAFILKANLYAIDMYLESKSEHGVFQISIF